MNVGFHSRDDEDNYTLSINFGTSGVFDDTPATSATLTGVTPTGLTVGDPSIAANVATFRVSGGEDGVEYEVTIKATNGVDSVSRSITVQAG